MSDAEKKEILEPEKDLGADELDEVAGGGECVCVIGGGGTGNPVFDEKTCACVFGGGGEYTDKGAVFYEEKARCYCVVGGHGDGIS